MRRGRSRSWTRRRSTPPVWYRGTSPGKPMRGAPRVALFTDAYTEANGVARVSRDLEAYAARCGFPFLCVYAGGATRVTEHGLGLRLELRRSAAAFSIEHDLGFDLLLWRHLPTVTRVLGTFR